MALTLSRNAHPGWLEIAVDIHPVAHEAMGAFLFDLGSEGIVTEDVGDHALKAYLPFRSDLENIRIPIDVFLQELKKIFPDIPSPTVRFSRIENEDWGLSWRRFFHPEPITPGLMVIPAWEPVPQSPGFQVIRIDPGPAFGTGQHATTRMCLKAIEEIPLQGSWSMLDVGTGSGILAIYGAMQGADGVVAIDIDPEAIRWAERNVALNNLSERIALSPRPLEAWDRPFTIVAANLILGAILELFPHLSRVVDVGGWLILSGLLREQISDVERGLPEFGLSKDFTLYEKEWACLVARKLK